MSVDPARRRTSDTVKMMVETGTSQYKPDKKCNLETCPKYMLQELPGHDGGRVVGAERGGGGEWAEVGGRELAGRDILGDWIGALEKVLGVEK